MEVVASLSQGRTAAAQCGLFTHKSVPVIFEPPFISKGYKWKLLYERLECKEHTISSSRNVRVKLMLQRQIKKNKMGGACSIYGGEVRTGF